MSNATEPGGLYLERRDGEERLIIAPSEKDTLVVMNAIASIAFALIPLATHVLSVVQPHIFPAPLSMGLLFLAIGLSHAWLLMRKEAPQILTLDKTGIYVDSGLEPALPRQRPTTHKRSSGLDLTMNLFRRRQRFTLTVDDLSTLELQKSSGGTVLTVHRGNERIQLADALSSDNRARLHAYLLSRYSLADRLCGA